MNITGEISAVIFDLDGVIVSTDEYHYLAWKKIADEEGIIFNRNINERLRGVSRMESLSILLEKAQKKYNAEEMLNLATRKNELYKHTLINLSPGDILPGVEDTLAALKKKNIKMGIASSSKNSPAILKYIGMDNFFDAVVDGNQISKSKPDPEVFLLAAKRLNKSPNECLVVEDADAGVLAAKNGGMKVLAVGSAAGNKQADFSAPTGLNEMNILQIIKSS